MPRSSPTAATLFGFPTYGLLWLGPFCAALHAQDLGQQQLLSGDGPLSLAGAYTAMADGPAATFYNPAALPFGPGGSIAGSLSIGLTDSYTVEGGFRSAGGADLTFDDDASIPVFVGATTRFGRGEGDQKQHALGVTTLVPSRIRRRFFDERFSDDAASSLLVRLEDRTRWYGAGYGLRISRDVSLGLSAFLARRTVLYEEAETSLTGGATAVTELSSRLSHVDLTTWLGVLRLGGYWRANQHLQLGGMFQLPSIQLGGGAEIMTLGGRHDTGGGTAVHQVLSTDPSTPLPWQLRLGMVLRFPNFLVTSDLSVRGPSGNTRSPVPLLGLSNPDETLTPSLRYFAASYTTKPVTNVALAISTVLFNRFPVRAGFFTNLSPVEEPLAGNRYLPDRIHTFGFSASVGYQGDDFDFNLGILGQFGSGTGLRPVSSSLGTAYERTNVSTQSLQLFISGAGTAASRLVRAIVPSTSTAGQPPEPEP